MLSVWVASKKWRIFREKEGNRLFACRKAADKDLVGTYYKALAYVNPGKKLQVTRRYGALHKGHCEVVSEVHVGVERSRY